MRTQATQARAFGFTGIAAALLLATSTSIAGGDYAYTDLGAPDGADSVVGVRMNNHGHVAGWSQYFGQGEPSLRGWVWTPDDGFTMLPPPPGFLNGRSRAMDISDNGIVAGDGGFDTGLAWRYENGEYTVTGDVDSMPIAYLGGINNAGDITGTAKDASFITDDHAWVDFNGGDLVSITASGRGTDVNNAQQVCGYTHGAFEAFRWDSSSGMQPLGTLGLAYSFAHAINDSGDVVGLAKSASGNTKHAWIYTDADGMQGLPAPFFNASTAIQINNDGHVVGMSERSGPDLTWLWTGGSSVTDISTLFDSAAQNVNVLEVRDINDAGQILIQVFDNNAADFRMAILTPPGQPVTGDLDGDGVVDVFDLLDLLSAWGSCGGSSCPADLDGDGVVNVFDLLELLANWN